MLAEKALELQPMLAEAHASRGLVSAFWLGLGRSRTAPGTRS
jgi:hypothetical protein